MYSEKLKKSGKPEVGDYRSGENLKMSMYCGA